MKDKGLTKAQEKELNVKNAKNKVERTKKDIDNKKREIEENTYNIGKLEKYIGLIDDEIEIRKKLNKIVINGLEKLDPEKKYERNNAYWENMKKLQEVEGAKQVIQLQDAKRTTQRQLKSTKEQLESLSMSLPMQEKELKEAEKDYLKIKR